jgi:citrate lyase beta subunit
MLTLNIQKLVSGIRPRRHVLYAPGDQIAKLTKASQMTTLDTSVFDLEDGVPPAKKPIARRNITSYISSNPAIVPEFAVRINSLQSRDGMRDLNEVILNSAVGKRLEVLILSKLEDVDELRFIDRWLDLNDLGHTRVLGLVETPLGLTKVNDLCTASKRLDGLIFGSEDFRSAAGISPLAGETAILFARSAIVAATRAHNLQAIDMTSIDFKDADVVTREAIRSRRLGFTGKQVIHPMQIECVTKAFTPDAAEVKRLTKLIVDFVRTFYVEGKGVIGTGGIMIEFPHVTDAIKGLILAGQPVERIQVLVDSVRAGTYAE